MRKNPVVHFEMPYEEAERVSGFYAKAFGWEMQPLGEKMGFYIIARTTETDDQQMVKTPGNINGGFTRKSDMYRGPSVVIEVEDIKAGIERVRQAGGDVLGEPTDIPGVGQYVMFKDTEGNQVSMLQPMEM